MRIWISSIFLLLVGTIALADSECPSSQTCDDLYSADFRIRYGHINDHNDLTKNANTLTGRLLLTLRTPQFGKFNAVFASEHVNDFGIDTYNDGGANGQSEYATEADPSGTEMDEAFIQYRGSKTQIRYGRQYINHGALPQRFLGTVAWRQNNHTYDGLTVNIKATDKFLFEGALIEKVYRLLGRDHPNPSAREWDLDGLGLRGTYQLGGRGGWQSLTGYAYDLDFVDNPGQSSFTYGLEASGQCFSDNVSFGWKGSCKLSVAGQKLDDDPDNSGTLLYAFGSIGVDFSNFAKDNETGSVAFSYSVLQGDGRSSFKTPLATLHGYAGSADKFLVNTPVTGLWDHEIRLKERAFRWNWTVALHIFTPTEDTEEGRYGSEIDIAATRTFGKYKWLFKMARYRGNDDWKNSYGRDASKFWTQVQFKL